MKFLVVFVPIFAAIAAVSEEEAWNQFKVRTNNLPIHRGISAFLIACCFQDIKKEDRNVIHIIYHTFYSFTSVQKKTIQL